MSIVITNYYVMKYRDMYRLKECFGSHNSKRLREWMTLGDLNVSDATSKFTKRKRAIRTSLYKGENVTAKIVKGSYDPTDDSFTFEFITPVTAKVYPPGSDFQKTDPNNNFQLVPNAEKMYHMFIKVLGFMELLRGTRPDSLQSSPITADEVKEVLEVAYVQLFCNDPSFQYQTANWTLSQVDASIYPTNIAPKHWNLIHGTDNYLCKHLKGLVDQIGFFLNPMASMATKVIKQENL